VSDFLSALKPEYARALRRVDLDGTRVRESATEEHITPNNASVRLHRARAALRREVERACGTCATHRCLDCSCQKESCSAE
jgi:RNA polymerase sigma-70 factor (ECF subfamily)